MIELRPEDVIHKSYLHRLLIEIVDQTVAAQTLALKGGTCARLRLEAKQQKAEFRSQEAGGRRQETGRRRAEGMEHEGLPLRADG